MVVGVAAVQLIEHLSHSHLQPGCKKLDILFLTQVQNPINPLCKMQLNVWPQSNLGRQIRGKVEKRQMGLRSNNVLIYFMIHIFVSLVLIRTIHLVTPGSDDP